MKSTYLIILSIFFTSFSTAIYAMKKGGQDNREATMFLWLIKNNALPQSMIKQLTPKQRVLILSLKKN